MLRPYIFCIFRLSPPSSPREGSGGLGEEGRGDEGMAPAQESLPTYESLPTPPYTRTRPGPAAFTASPTSLSYFLKLSANMSASLPAWAS
jgi:hypothetical protein